MIPEYSRQPFEKKSKLNNLKIRQWEPNCSMRTDGRTDT